MFAKKFVQKMKNVIPIERDPIKAANIQFFSLINKLVSIGIHYLTV